jgi:Rieske Fe-S protein
MQICTSLLALAHAPGSWARTAAAAERRYTPARLLDSQGKSLRYADVRPGETFIFHYPYVSTPCFLINLPEPVTPAALTTAEGRHYIAPAGVGPHSSVVAFSAICAHRMTHPVRSVNFINYRHDEASYVDLQEQPARRAGVIKCCSEKSVYDVHRGAAVLGGPAPQPLAAIAIEYDSDADNFTALGASGGVLFDKYLAEFHDRLVLEYGTDRIADRVGGSTQVLAMAEYCTNLVMC